MTSATLTEHLRCLWQIRRTLRPRNARPDLRTQTLRARVAVDTVIAELTTLQHHQARTPDGLLNLDMLTEETP